MTAVSTTFTLTVTATAETVLDKIVAAMVAQSPNDPLWSTELITDPVGGYELANNYPETRPAGWTAINDRIGPKGTGPTTNPPALPDLPTWAAYNSDDDFIGFQILPGNGGPSKSHYDPVLRQWWHVTGSTGKDPYAQTVVRYNVDRDEFRHWQGSGPATTDGIWHPCGLAHCFNMSALDLSRRRMYRLLDTVALNGSSAFSMFWFDIDTTDSNLTAGGPIANSAIALSGKFSAMECFPALDSIILWRADGLVGGRPIKRYDISSGLWVEDCGTTRFGNSQQPALVNCNGAMYAPGVTVEGSSIMYKLDANKQLTEVAPPPVLMNSIGDRDDRRHTECAALGTDFYAFRPGELTGDGEVWKYDTLLDSWSLVDTFDPYKLKFLTGNQAKDMTITAVPDLNCILMAVAIDQNGYNGRAIVWKP